MSLQLYHWRGLHRVTVSKVVMSSQCCYETDIVLLVLLLWDRARSRAPMDADEPTPTEDADAASNAMDAAEPAAAEGAGAAIINIAIDAAGRPPADNNDAANTAIDADEPTPTEDADAARNPMDAAEQPPTEGAGAAILTPPAPRGRSRKRRLEALPEAPPAEGSRVLVLTRTVHVEGDPESALEGVIVEVEHGLHGETHIVFNPSIECRDAGKPLRFKWNDDLRPCEITVVDEPTEPPSTPQDFKLRRRAATARAAPVSAASSSSSAAAASGATSAGAVDIDAIEPAAAVAATIGNGLEVRSVGDDDFGLFTTRLFKSNEPITRYDGESLLGKEQACDLEVQTHVTSKDGVYVDGYRLAQQFRADALSVEGRGGGTFANHDAKPNAETFLMGDRSGASYNCIFLRVKKGKTILPGQQVTLFYGKEGSLSLKVAMGEARFRAEPPRAPAVGMFPSAAARAPPKALPLGLEVGKTAELRGAAPPYGWVPCVITEQRPKNPDRLLVTYEHADAPDIGRVHICNEE